MILCIETGTEVCSVALALDGKVIAIRQSEKGRDHASKLSVFIDELLKDAKISAKQLSAVAVSKGPGSYTGLRIGVSTAKALCYALNIPLLSIGSLDSLAVMALKQLTSVDTANAVLCPMIDARRMEVYTQMFNSKLEMLSDAEAHVLSEESFSEQLAQGSDFYVFGDGAKKSLDLLPGANYLDVTPSAEGLAELAEQSFKKEQFEDTAYFEPLYLKDFLVHKSKKKFF